mgnify:CR=1 FL=1
MKYLQIFHLIRYYGIIQEVTMNTQMIKSYMKIGFGILIQIDFGYILALGLIFK